MNLSTGLNLDNVIFLTILNKSPNFYSMMPGIWAKLISLSLIKNISSKMSNKHEKSKK